MATYNIEMNTLNSSGVYDQLFPRTYLTNVLDWSNTIYSKTEVDNSINSLKTSIETEYEMVLKWDYVTYTGTGSGTQTVELGHQMKDIILLFIIPSTPSRADGMIMAISSVKNMVKLGSSNGPYVTDGSFNISGTSIKFTSQSSAGSFYGKTTYNIYILYNDTL